MATSHPSRIEPKSTKGTNGTLNNENTHFGSFKWADNKKLMDAIQKVRDQMGGTLPIRFKVKL